MPNSESAAKQEHLARHLSKLAHARRDRLIQTIVELIQIPSKNTPLLGSEGACQRYVFDRLSRLELKAEMDDLLEVARIGEHPEFKPGRDYTDRPNVAAVWPGSGGGRVLLLSGHIDTVPRGSEPWQRDPSALRWKAIASTGWARMI